MADVDLDERVTALEENGGGGTQHGNKTKWKFFFTSNENLLLPQAS